MPMYLNVLDACEDDVQMKSPGGMTERSICMHPGPPNSSPMALPLASALHNFFSSPEAACVAGFVSLKNLRRRQEQNASTIAFSWAVRRDLGVRT